MSIAYEDNAFNLLLQLSVIQPPMTGPSTGAIDAIVPTTAAE